MPRPRSLERSEERARLADRLARRGISDPAVLQAIRDVPRHWFVPDRVAGSAYEDEALPLGKRQTVSQPFVVALMTQALALAGHSKVLEIGTGSGYQTAVLAELADEVWTLEVIPELAERARTTFREHGYDRIHAAVGDGWEGWPEQAPFDAVIVTAAPDRLPEKLFEQLASGGRLCLPIGADPSSQELLLVRKETDGSPSVERLGGVRFVPMTGAGPTEG